MLTNRCQRSSDDDGAAVVGGSTLAPRVRCATKNGAPSHGGSGWSVPGPARIDHGPPRVLPTCPGPADPPYWRASNRRRCGASLGLKKQARGSCVPLRLALTVLNPPHRVRLPAGRGCPAHAIDATMGGFAGSRPRARSTSSAGGTRRRRWERAPGPRLSYDTTDGSVTLGLDKKTATLYRLSHLARAGWPPRRAFDFCHGRGARGAQAAPDAKQTVDLATKTWVEAEAARLRRVQDGSSTSCRTYGREVGNLPGGGVAGSQTYERLVGPRHRAKPRAERRDRRQRDGPRKLAREGLRSDSRSRTSARPRRGGALDVTVKHGPAHRRR